MATSTLRVGQPFRATVVHDQHRATAYPARLQFVERVERPHEIVALDHRADAPGSGQVDDLVQVVIGAAVGPDQRRAPRRIVEVCAVSNGRTRSRVPAHVWRHTGR